MFIKWNKNSILISINSMFLKYRFVLLFLLLFIFADSSYGQNPSPIQKQENTMPTTFAGKDKIDSQMQHNASKITNLEFEQRFLNLKAEHILKNLEQEREILVQKQKTYDTFLTTVTIILGLYGLVLTALLGIAAYFGYKNIKDLKEEIRDKLSKDISEKAQSLIKETMKDNYGQQLAELQDRMNRFENYIKDLWKALELKQSLPRFPEEKEDKKEERNIFDEE